MFLFFEEQKIILSNIDRRSNITVLRNNKEKLLGTNKYLLHHSVNFLILDKIFIFG